MKKILAISIMFISMNCMAQKLSTYLVQFKNVERKSQIDSVCNFFVDRYIHATSCVYLDSAKTFVVKTKNYLPESTVREYMSCEGYEIKTFLKDEPSIIYIHPSKK